MDVACKRRGATDSEIGDLLQATELPNWIRYDSNGNGDRVCGWLWLVVKH
ncbi:hypothetical protein GL2_33090 [Microbulbifer sp. GL-2]|nr:hypothetical protein GL2_33090 [Microbulbifer sp. GL-2]